MALSSPVKIGNNDMDEVVNAISLPGLLARELPRLSQSDFKEYWPVTITECRDKNYKNKTMEGRPEKLPMCRFNDH